MGLKDNFQQALRELTGTDKEENAAKQNKASIDAMKNAVAAGDTGEFDAIKEIDRRAAAAASEYDRQQRVFTDGASEPYDRYTNEPYYAQTQQQSSFGKDVDYNAQTGSFLGINEDRSSLSLGQGMPTGNNQQEPGLSFSSQDTGASQQPRQNAYQQPQQNAYQQPQQGGYQQSQQNAYQQPQQNAYQQSQQDGYQQPQQNGYQQSQQGGSANSYYTGAPAASNPAADQARIFSAARYGHPLNEDDEITVISKNTVIDGNVRSFANMAVDGNIKGNIETTKDIDLNGKIVGNIACNNAQMRTSQIQGNIQMKGNAYMERDTLLIGDLTSTYANVNGKIKGNLDITGKAELKSDAVVFGDISASTITVNDGAIIQGYVSTTFLNKEESKNIFPDTITIGE